MGHLTESYEILLLAPSKAFSKYMCTQAPCLNCAGSVVQISALGLIYLLFLQLVFLMYCVGNSCCNRRMNSCFNGGSLF